MTKPAIKYRPDIDGLRALAVVAVIIFHFKSEWLPGGFLGVDAFFVISGFLITSIIARQLEKGTFTFRDFYARRIKRILPLFFTVLLATMLVAIVLFDTRDFDEFWRSAKYAMQFRANRAFSGQGYFSPISEEKPLLHLWSLAIEEQFYFFWPLIFFIIYKIVKNRENPRTWAFWFAIAGIILGVLFTENRMSTEPAKAYFELSTRAAELLVGCALALNPYTLGDRKKHILGIIGLLVFIACIILYSSSIPFPGITAMLPVIAVALFIYDTNVDAPYKRLFTNPVVRTIGLWSFSLYLWHWPVLAFMRYIHNSTDLPISWMIVAAIMIPLLSIFTYYCVENPIRRVKLKFLSSFIFIYILPALVIVGIHYAAVHQPLSTVFRLNDPRTITNWADSEMICMDSPITDSCYVGDQSSDFKLLVIGDSHAGHLANFMDVVGNKEGFKAHVLASGGCAFPESSATKSLAADSNNTCGLLNEYLVNDYGKYDAVLISQYLSAKIEADEFIQSNYFENFKNIVENIAKEKDVYLVSDTPTLTVPSVLRHMKLEKLGLEQFMQLRTPNDHHRANELLKEMANQNENIHFVDIARYTPENGIIDGTPIYFDKDHMNLYGSQKVGELFIEEQSLLQQDPNQDRGQGQP